MTVLFVVGSGVQLDSAKRVAAHLSRPSAILDIWHAEIVGIDEMQVSGHMAPVTMNRLRTVGKTAARWAQTTKDGVLVAPQDVGLVYRRAIAAARRGGAHIAFLPDGAVSERKVTARRMLWGLVPAADAALRSVGYVAGRHGQMGACRPHLVLSWGPAWNPVFEKRGASQIVNVGNPRSDDLASVPGPVEGQILICSQPMDHLAIGGAPAAAIWYEFLERIAVSAPSGKLKIRLHPAEVDKLDALPLGEHTRAVLTHGTSLTKDLSWAGAVVSWASTTMLEAAGAGRPVVSLAVNPAAAELAQSYYFQRDPRVVTALTGEVSDFSALAALTTTARNQQAGLAEDYLVNIGSAAKTAAAALDEM